MSTDQSEGRVGEDAREEVRWFVGIAKTFLAPVPNKSAEIECRAQAILTEIDRLRAERDELREVLKPFADHGKAMEGCCETDQWDEVEGPHGWVHWLAVQHFFDARRALHTKGDGDE